MLIQLIILRLVPLAALFLFKKNIRLKVATLIIGFVELLMFGLAIYIIVGNSGWKAMIFLPAALIPQCFFYGFSSFIILRCVWKAWSIRVWNRIIRVAFVLTILGIILEYYLNPKILIFFLKKF